MHVTVKDYHEYFDANTFMQVILRGLVEQRLIYTVAEKYNCVLRSPVGTLLPSAFRHRLVRLCFLRSAFAGWYSSAFCRGVPAGERRRQKRTNRRTQNAEGSVIEPRMQPPYLKTQSRVLSNAPRISHKKRGAQVGLPPFL